MRKHLPNFITLLNLAGGLVAVIGVFINQVWLTAGAIAFSLLMDFLDGMVARLLGVSSPIGKELDSLADNVSFGVVPALAMARMIAEANGNTFPPNMQSLFEWLWLVPGLLISLFATLRLAKFNLDTRQGDVFYGVPTPAMTMLVISLWIILGPQSGHWLAVALNKSWILVVISLALCGLMVADVKLLALKVKHLRWSGNQFRYLLLIGSLALLLIFKLIAIPFIFLLYLALSLLANRLEPQASTGPDQHV
ncbi:MAG: CDP-alcohol phosphatidyltransferase family protein [Bacteroidota bacterium]